MEPLLGNLLFTFVVKVGGIALGLGLAILFGRWALRRQIGKLKRKHQKRLNHALLVSWVGVVGLVALTTIQSNTPRFTVSDHTARGPDYQDSEIRNMDPATKTDTERIQDTRRLVSENEAP